MRRNLCVQFLRFSILCILISCLFLTLDNSRIQATYATINEQQSWNCRGPYVDKAIFRIMTRDEQRAALITGVIDHVLEYPDFDFWWEPPPTIGYIESKNFDLYGITINCQHYPYSLPEFRRALVYAIDKFEFADVLWAGIGYPLDSPITTSTPPWHNPDVEGTFYESDVPAAIAALESAGFIDCDGDGYREAPNGESFTFRLAYHHVGTNWQAAWQSQAATFEEIGIDFEPFAVDFNTYLDQMYQIPRAYEAVSYCYSTGPDPLFLAEFRTELIPEPYGNVWNWSNETFDDAMDNMLAATTFEDALEYAHEAQEILVENVPLIPLCIRLNVHVVRNDHLEGWINSPGYGIGLGNHWTPQKVRLIEGQPDRDPVTGCGGTYTASIRHDIETQNPLNATDDYSKFILSQIYTSLVGDLHPITLENTPYGNGLASGWTKTIVSTPTPHWEFTFDLHTNATWHDGVAVTADDVVFSYNYIYENQIPAYALNFEYFGSIVKVDGDTVKIIATSDSYWTWEYLNDWTILPEHIWNGIIYPETYTNPIPIGCGPFRWVQRVPNEYIELHSWAGYHRSFYTNGPVDGFVSLLLPLSVAIIAIVITLSVIYLSRDQQTSSDSEVSTSVKSDQSRTEKVQTKLTNCPVCNTRLWGDENFCPGCAARLGGREDQ